MNREDILNIIKNRELNSKTNNMIISGSNVISLLEDIPSKSEISFISEDINITSAINIKIDLNIIKTSDILTYTLNYLVSLGYINKESINELPFTNRIILLKYEKILKDNNIIIQLLFYNNNSLNNNDQLLFNELYYYFSYYFNVISFVENHFNSYFLSNNRVLDNREDYQKYDLDEDSIIDFKRIKNL